MHLFYDNESTYFDFDRQSTDRNTGGVYRCGHPWHDRDNCSRMPASQKESEVFLVTTVNCMRS